MPDLARLIETSHTVRAYADRLECLTRTALQQTPVANDTDGPTELRRAIALVHRDAGDLMASIDRLWQSIG